jgi:hypothetical protein
MIEENRIEESRDRLATTQVASYQQRIEDNADLDSCTRIVNLLRKYPGLTHKEMVEITELCHQTISSMCTVLVLGGVIRVGGTETNTETGKENRTFFVTGKVLTKALIKQARENMRLLVPSTPELRAALQEVANRENGKLKKGDEGWQSAQDIAARVLNSWMDGTLVPASVVSGNGARAQ